MAIFKAFFNFFFKVCIEIEFEWPRIDIKMAYVFIKTTLNAFNLSLRHDTQRMILQHFICILVSFHFLFFLYGLWLFFYFLILELRLVCIAIDAWFCYCTYGSVVLIHWIVFVFRGQMTVRQKLSAHKVDRFHNRVDRVLGHLDRLLNSFERALEVFVSFFLKQFPFGIWDKLTPPHWLYCNCIINIFRRTWKRIIYFILFF